MAENDILTPVGRLVQGDCFEGQTKDAEGKPLVVREGPNAGKERTTFFMALAIPKTEPTYAALWAQIHGEAARSFPTLFDAQGNCSLSTFAFKVRDGDSTIPNQSGKRPCDLEGFPGHWILNFSGGFAPKVYRKGGQELVQSPEEVKRGYYVRIAGSVAGNGSLLRPGVYLNHSMVELCGYGTEIYSGPDPALFGESPAAALPAGASATPLAPTSPPPGAAAPVAGQTAFNVATGGPPMPGAAVPEVAPIATPPVVVTPLVTAPLSTDAMPAQGIKPAPDFLNVPPGTVTTPAPGVTLATPPPPTGSMPPGVVTGAPFRLPDGSQWTREQLVQAGYTEQAIALLPQS